MNEELAATRLVWTAVILNSSETSGPVSNWYRVVKMCSLEGVSLIAGMEYGMERWNGKWNGKVNVHSYS